MTCRKSREYISRSIDDGLSDKEDARLERHLAACGECRALREDLRKIVDGAARLETPEPSDRVWLGIRAGLTRESGGRAREEAGAFRRPAFGMGWPVLSYVGAGAVALALVITGIAVGRRLGRAPAPMGPQAREQYTLAKLDEAERYYQQAIKSLSEAFAAEKGALAPQVAELFDRNLSVIDATIQACRRAVIEEPDDLEARNYLLAAYTQKLTLLDSALDLQRTGRDATGRTKIL